MYFKYDINSFKCHSYRVKCHFEGNPKASKYRMHRNYRRARKHEVTQSIELMISLKSSMIKNFSQLGI